MKVNLKEIELLTSFLKRFSDKMTSEEQHRLINLAQKLYLELGKQKKKEDEGLS